MRKARMESPGLFRVVPWPEGRVGRGECNFLNRSTFLPPSPRGRVKRLQAVWGGGAEGGSIFAGSWLVEAVPRPRPIKFFACRSNFLTLPQGEGGKIFQLSALHFLLEPRPYQCFSKPSGNDAANDDVYVVSSVTRRPDSTETERWRPR